MTEQKLTPLAWDSEAFLIGIEHGVIPRGICWSFASREEGGDISTMLLGNSPCDESEDALRTLFESEDLLLITQNGGFDYALVCRTYPSLIPQVFDVIESGRATDTLWREKLLNLSEKGKLKTTERPDGSKMPILYALDQLVKGYLGIDISATKSGDDVWRLNYSELDGWQASDYPPDAAAYACDDAVHTLLVYEAQEERKARTGGSTETEAFQLASSFALKLMTAWGMQVNGPAVDVMEEQLNILLADEKMVLLLESGIMTPSQPEREQVRNGKTVICRTGPNAGQPKMVMAKASKINTKTLQAHVAELFHSMGEIPELTDSGLIKLDAEVQEYLADKCPIMAQYYLRKSLQKLTSNQLPAFRMALETTGVMHFDYDVLKETGRTSSYDGGKRKGQDRMYPGTNGQQVPNEISTTTEGQEWVFDPRRNYEPREGTVFFDVDYTALELGSVGQITYDLFGKSVHMDRYNRGWDLHSFLGSQLALRSDVGISGEFAQACRAEGILDDQDAVYEAFRQCKDNDDGDLATFFGDYRSFAKPVGLGFPGGLGAATMVDFARKTYGVTLSEREAREFKEMWLEVYPEMVQFFSWINGQTDPYNLGKDGKSLYTYTSPLGMVRSGASFCAAANGKVMQTPGAEGAKMAMIRLQRECYDPSVGSVLLGCRPIGFVHDQIIGETSRDSSLWHDQTMRVSDIMIESMRLVLPDIKMRSDEAMLTSIWTKKAKPVRDSNNKLIPWRPAA